VVLVLTIKSGHSVRYYTDATTEARENYYTGAAAEGEPPGRWYGSGAAELGLSGLVEAQDMIGVYERFLDPRAEGFKDPDTWDELSTLGHTGRRYLSEEQIYRQSLDAEPDADPQRRDELRVEAGQRARHNVSYLDATLSVQKSITVTHAAFEAQEIQSRRAGDEDSAAAWGTLRQAVEDAIWAGNNAALDYLSEHAGYSRIGHHGGSAGRWIDAHDFTVASFFQHDSRDHDPHLHIHNTILNRVQCADGQWRTLDSRAIHAFRPAAAAVAERTTEEHLTASLGVLAAMRPDGKARELLGVPEQVRELLSSRNRAIGPKQAELIEAFETRHGRAPTALERDRLSRQAMLVTRRTKVAGETTEQRLDRVEAQVAAELGAGLSQVAHDVLALAGKDRPKPQAWSTREVLETALAAVQEKQSAWTPPDLTREISNALPDYLGITEPGDMGRLLDELTAKGLALAVPLDAAKPGDDVLARQFRLADGRSAFDAPGRARFATPEHLHTERLLVASTMTRDACATSTANARAFVARLAESGIELGADQTAVLAGVLTSGARVESLVGPAGTGKSFVLGALAQAWNDPRTWTDSAAVPDEPATPAGGGRMFGLAASERATGVLTGEGLTAANTAAWLATQTRLADGQRRDGDERWALNAGDLVVIDESSMADTAAVAAVHDRVRAAGAKLLLVGDHKQLGAVGAGGLSELLAERGPSYELTEVRRFDSPWERAASLGLRAGDPAALEDYHRNGRVLDGGTLADAEAAAARGWLVDTLGGKQSILVVDSNDQAARINADLRAQLVGLGRVTENGLFLGREGSTAGVGDVVQARRLAWELAGYAGNRRGPINREQYRVLETGHDGRMVVAPIISAGGPDGAEVLGERMTLPAGYVEKDLTLGYAATVHAAEGLTVDTGHTVATPRTSANALYPAATRGRTANHLYVVTRTADEDAAPGEVAQAITRNPRAVLATILDTANPERSALATADESAAEAESIRATAERLAVVADVAVAERTSTWLDELTATGELTFAERRRLAAEDGAHKLAPALRRVELAGGDARAALTASVTERSLHGAQQISNVLFHRLTDGRTFDPVGTTFGDWTPATNDPELADHLAALSGAADARRGQLGAHLAAEPPAWALGALGPVPAEPAERADWVGRAGAVAAHRELVDHDDPTDVLGVPPKAGQVEAYASWRAAWRALGRSEVDRHEQTLTDGQLRMRVRAYQREQAWAPRRVVNELAGTIQAADQHRATATLKTAQAEAEHDPAVRERLTVEATEAAALADTLAQHTETLEGLDDAWAHWYAHTAGTRAAADRAHAELSNRHVSGEQGDDRVTAAEWLTAHDEAVRVEEAHREITESDVTDADDSETSVSGTARADERGDIRRAKQHVHSDDAIDLRERVADEAAPVDQDAVRVPSAQETTESVRRAERALAEICARDAADAENSAAESRAEQLSRWHAEDTRTAEDAHTAEQAEPVLERADHG
jgi:hypothetical protein